MEYPSVLDIQAHPLLKLIHAAKAHLRSSIGQDVYGHFLVIKVSGEIIKICLRHYTIIIGYSRLNAYIGHAIKKSLTNTDHAVVYPVRRQYLALLRNHIDRRYSYGSAQRPAMTDNATDVVIRSQVACSFFHPACQD